MNTIPPNNKSSITLNIDLSPPIIDFSDIYEKKSKKSKPSFPFVEETTQQKLPPQQQPSSFKSQQSFVLPPPSVSAVSKQQSSEYVKRPQKKIVESKIVNKEIRQIELFIPENTLVIYYDFETTGLNPYSDNIIECAMILKNNIKTVNFNSFVKYTERLKPIIVSITKIREINVQNAPSLEEIFHNFFNNQEIQQMFSGVQKIIWVAHNGYGFDMLFWNKYFQAYFKNYTNVQLDTMRLIQFLDSTLDSYKLTDVAKSLQIEREGVAHRALYDTELVMDITNAMSQFMYFDIRSKYRVNPYQHPEIVYNLLNNCNV